MTTIVQHPPTLLCVVRVPQRHRCGQTEIFSRLNEGAQFVAGPAAGMGRIAHVPECFWLVCRELDRDEPRVYVVPSLQHWLDELVAHPAPDHELLTARWQIGVTHIDVRVPLQDVQAQFRRDGGTFNLQKTVEIDLSELQANQVRP